MKRFIWKAYGASVGAFGCAKAAAFRPFSSFPRQGKRMNYAFMNSGRFGGPQPSMFNQKCRLCRCFWIRPEGALARPKSNQFRHPDFARNFREKIQKSGSSFFVLPQSVPTKEEAIALINI